jgi:hypothetical protein
MEDKDVFNNDEDLNNDEKDKFQDIEEDIYLDLSNIKLA